MINKSQYIFETTDYKYFELLKKNNNFLKHKTIRRSEKWVCHEQANYKKKR